MAQHDQDNDEYRFAELDSLDSDPMGGADSEQHSNISSGQNKVPGKDIKRNALIAIGLVVFAMVMYKFIGYMFFSEPTDSVVTKAEVPPITQVTPQPVPTTTITPAPVQQIQQTQQVVPQVDPEMASKVSAIEMSQQSLRSEVSSLSEQVATINNNVNNLNAQIANLNQVIGTLSNQMAKQSEVISVLIAKAQPKKVKPVVRYVPQRVKYNIQAVIPGRAWLIGTNGSTITVREGTKVAGYGIVKLIDSMQGRVLTSSGQVIRFSQNDS